MEVGQSYMAERTTRLFSRLFDLQDEVPRDIAPRLSRAVDRAWCAGIGHSGAKRQKITLTAGWHVVECPHADNRAAIAPGDCALKENQEGGGLSSNIDKCVHCGIFLGWTEDPQDDVEKLLEAARSGIALVRDLQSQVLWWRIALSARSRRGLG